MTDAVIVPSEVASLEPFVRAGVLGATEVHTAAALCRHADRCGHEVLLAAALAVRSPLHGHVCVDLATVRDTVVTSLESADGPVAIGTDADATDGGPTGPAGPTPALPNGAASPSDATVAERLDALDWPDPTTWLDAVRAAPFVASVPPGHDGALPRGTDGRLAPLVLERDRLYLARFWSLERYAAADLVHRASNGAGGPARPVGAGDEIRRLFHSGGAPVDPDQLAAASAGTERDLVVISGGPGTGKTTTVAHFLAGLVAADAGPTGTAGLRLALAAPTGKAAARMTEAVRSAVRSLADHLDDDVIERLDTLEAVTIHRLLGRADGAGFRHRPEHPLPHDLVIVDEVSMVSLSLMAHLLAAVRPDATVVLVGDPYQLASVEAGAVLGDIVAGSRAGAVGGGAVGRGAAGGGLRDSVRTLRTVHRQAEGSGILELASAIRDERTDDVFELLGGERADLRWVEIDHDGAAPGLEPVEDELARAARSVIDAARDGDVDAALDGLLATKVLCAHRRGELGVDGWNLRLERRLGVGSSGPGRHGPGGPGSWDPWYEGRPVMVTRNDYLNGVFNGDVGVAARDGDHFAVWFPRAAGNQRVPSARLDRIATQWAMSIHKSQGSEFGHVVVVLPDPRSRILTRELLYTAVTRAKHQLTIVSSAASLRTAIGRPVQRASGLADRLTD